LDSLWRLSRLSGGVMSVLILSCVLTVGQVQVSSAATARSALAQNPAVDTPIEMAWSWVQSMLRTPSRVESTSVLMPEREYPTDWIDQVKGTFLVRGVSRPPVVPASVALGAQSTAAATDPAFRGVITGRITLEPQENRWVVQAYRMSAGHRWQVPAQSLVRLDGSFDIDVSDVEPGPGSWQFGLLDALTGYAPVGVPWPSTGTYSGWQIRSFATTDRLYLSETQPASVDGTFSFDSTAPGAKSFQLVATAGGDNDPPEKVLAEYAPVTGLVRSFAAPSDSGAVDGPMAATSYSYDQALAVQAALVMDDLPTARLLAQGLLTLQTTSGPQAGGFISAAPQSNPAAGQRVFRTGNTAVALYALLSYLRSDQQSDPEHGGLMSAAQQAADWLLRQQVISGPMSGLLTGGWGEAGSSLQDPLPRLPFASTEHNLDAWQALSLAGRVLACQRCAATADALHDAIGSILWDPNAAHFSQGMQPGGRDSVDALDVNSWGSIFLDGTGQHDLAALSMTHTSAFAVSDSPISGFLAFRPQSGIPTPVPAVWFEGSFGVALAQARHGDDLAHDNTMAALEPAQRNDGSFPIATSPDSARDLITASGIASTAWFILASRPNHPNAIWAAPPDAGR
jgi:hypothetical protein